MAGDNWELPKPIFRTSEGSTAAVAKASKSVEPIASDELTLDADENLSSLYLPPEPVQAGAMPPEVASVEIEEQPFISEQLTAERIVTALPEDSNPIKRSGSAFATILLVLFLVLAALVAAVFYVFFIRQPADTTF